MRMGFTFNKKHSSEFGIVMKTISRPIQPEVKSYRYDTPLMDGVYDFSDANSFKHIFYKNRTFVLKMQIFAKGIYDLQQKISAVSSWLSGKGELVFDDMPLVKWKASVINGIDYAPERRGHKAVLSVSFDVEPFSLGVFEPHNDVYIEEEIPVSAPVSLDLGEAFSYFVYSDDLITPPVMEIINTGTWYVMPKIKLNVWGCTGVNIRCGDKSLTIMGDHTEEERFNIIIDCEKKTVVYADGRDITANVTGEFLELAPGKNQVRFENFWYGHTNMQGYYAKFEYVPRYMYDFDYAVWEELNNA